jgi:hypothetical protein
MEKHLQHQKNLFHNFIALKKAFDRVWHDGLWQVLRKFGIGEGLIQTINALYNTSGSAVLLNNQIVDYFKTTVGVRQGCSLSPVLFNLYLESIMREIHDFHSTVSIGGKTISNLRFADGRQQRKSYKTLPTDWKTEQVHMEWKRAPRKVKSW